MMSALATAKAIARAVRAARRKGQTPRAIILSPALHRELRIPALRYVWSTPKQDALFGVPVKVDPGVEGWAVRVR